VSLLKVFSGWWSDRIGRRKSLTLGGYWLSTISKPFLAIASNWSHALGVRLTDRVGKGIRDPPRDALIADSCAPEVRGKAFGLHRAFDTIGAVLGPLLVLILLLFLGIRDIFLLASIPAVLAVVVIVFFVREVRKRPSKLSFMGGLGSLTPAFRRYLVVVVLFSISNLSYGFLILQAIDLGLGTWQVVLLYMFYNVIYALVSLPAGILSDRIGRRPVIAAGYSIFGFTTLGLTLATSAWQVIPLFILYGIFMGLVDGTQRAYVADLVSPKLRGTAMGAFHTATGLALLPASLIAGALWQIIGLWAAFLFASGVSFTAALLMATFSP
jgi:MFS family permease